jgi:hypothetical protein
MISASFMKGDFQTIQDLRVVLATTITTTIMAVKISLTQLGTITLC